MSAQPVNEHGLYGDPNPESVEMLAARHAALGLLEDVLVRRHALDQALEDSAPFRALPSRDRAFCRMLAATALRRLGQIDDLIARAENRPDPKKNPVLQNILRLGIAQIAFMNVPDHAAVDTAVRLADAAALERQKGFVNGLLRTVARVWREWTALQDEARLNTPEWLLKTWVADYGLKTAAGIATANLSEAPLDISVKDAESRIYWAGVLQASEMPGGSLRRLQGGAVHELPGFDDGMWWVQDAAAALPARLLGAIAGEDVLDLCAAPGGKTAQLAAMGANVTALDRSAQRLKRLEENLKRLRLEERVRVIASDAGVWRPKEPPSYILLDAPCSATGTIRRHPDVPHLKDPADMARLVEVQRNILANAFDMLRPGGVLVYCTCSLQKDEGERQIDYLLGNRRDAKILPVSADELGGMADPVTGDGTVRVLPFHQAARGGLDGFFIARLAKA